MKQSNFDRWLTTEPELRFEFEIEWHEDSSKENEDDFDQLYCDGDDCFVAIGNYMGYGEDHYGRDVEHYAMRIYGVVNGKRFCEDCIEEMKEGLREIPTKESLDESFMVR